MLKRSLAFITLRSALVVVALLCSCSAGWAQSGREPKIFQGFTLVRQVTDYDNEGNEFAGPMETLYVSSSGDWRWVVIHPNGQTADTIYIWEKGVFFTDHRNRQLVKMGEVGSGRPQPTTAKQLEASPSFVRTDSVLGQFAFVHRKKHHSYFDETYYVPELGPFPFMRVNYHKNYKRVEAPVSLTFGQPEESQLRVADYPLFEQQPLFDQKLNDRIEEKPTPKYSSEARAAGITGKVVLQVIVDEAGRVTRAAVITNLPLVSDAAIEAAFLARFLPGECDGKPVKVSGSITYHFPPQ